MKCDAVQKALVVGSLSEGDLRRRWLLRRHLRSCNACQAALAELQWLETELPRWRSAEPSPTLEASVLTALLQASPHLETPHRTSERLSLDRLRQQMCELKENPTMKRRFALSLVLLMLISGGLLTSSLRSAPALTRLNRLQIALHNVHNVHMSIWETGLLPGGQFYRRELWVQGGLLRQYIKGKLWQISTPDTNWYYIAEEDRLLRQAHKQAPVTVDITSLLRNIKGVRKDGQGVQVEAGDDSELRGRQVALLQITQFAPSQEELDQERAQREEAQRHYAELMQMKGQTPPPPSENTATPQYFSKRTLYWVDKATNLPLHSEDYEEHGGKWKLMQRVDYYFDDPVPADFFDPQALLRAGRQEVNLTKNRE